MGHEVLGESLSAVMDGQADELELRRILAASGSDAELRQRWSRYQLARDALHGTVIRPQLDLASAVAAAIDAEDAAATAVAAPASVSRSGGWKGLAVAASVTLAVLAGARFYGAQQGPDTQVASVGAAVHQAAPPQPLHPAGEMRSPAMLASYPAPAATPQKKPVDDPQILRQLPQEPSQQQASAPRQ